MKKILLTLALAFCCAAGQGQTTAKPADVNIQELNTKWAKFTQYAEQKQINKAVEEGIRISTLFTQNRQYKEAFATCRQMDALIYYNEQEKKSPEYKLRFMVGKERLRMYTNLKNTEQCKILLKQLHSYTDLLKSDSLQEELLMTEANYYQTFGMTDKSLECYNILFQKRSTGKDEKGIDQCYKDMLGYAEQNNNAPLAIAMRKLYTSWQDSIKAVKTANELNTLQQKYETSQKILVRRFIGKYVLFLFSFIGTFGMPLPALQLLKILTLGKHGCSCLALQNECNIENFIIERSFCKYNLKFIFCLIPFNTINCVRYPTQDNANK